jgi:hypothetical protein
LSVVPYTSPSSEKSFPSTPLLLAAAGEDNSDFWLPVNPQSAMKASMLSMAAAASNTSLAASNKSKGKSLQSSKKSSRRSSVNTQQTNVEEEDYFTAAPAANESSTDLAENEIMVQQGWDSVELL